MERDERIEGKIDKIQEDITDIKITLAKQHVVLVEHESRSTKLESIVLPLNKKLTMAEGVIKFIASIGVIVGLINLIKLFI